MLYLLRASYWIIQNMGQAALQTRIPGRRIIDLPGMACFAAAVKRRITHCAYGTAYLTALFCSLRQTQLRAEEARLTVYLSALVGYFDDLREAPLANQSA